MLLSCCNACRITFTHRLMLLVSRHHAWWLHQSLPEQPGRLLLPNSCSQRDNAELKAPELLLCFNIAVTSKKNQKKNSRKMQ